MFNRFDKFVGGLCLVAFVSCGSQELPISGRVLVDEAPMQSGTLHFAPVDSEAGKSAGGMVEEGVIQMASGHGLMPGKYRVSATAFRKTGKTINDYQRGPIEEMVQVPLQDSPQEIELSSDLASDFTVRFTSTSRKR